MKISFFADHCVPNSVISKLQDEGFTVLKLRDYFSAIEKSSRNNTFGVKQVDSFFVFQYGN